MNEDELTQPTWRAAEMFGSTARPRSSNLFGMGNVLTDDVPELLDFVCPRCQLPASQRFYGPCDDCVEKLKVSQNLNKQAAAATEYIPKMNVTPNAVATKD